MTIQFNSHYQLCIEDIRRTIKYNTLFKKRVAKITSHIFVNAAVCFLLGFILLKVENNSSLQLYDVKSSITRTLGWTLEHTYSDGKIFFFISIQNELMNTTACLTLSSLSYLELTLISLFLNLTVLYYSEFI